MPCRYLAIESQHDDHEEEQDGPQRRHSHLGHSLGVGDEGQPGAGLRHHGNVRVLLLGHEAQHGEHNEACVQAGERVHTWDQDAVSEGKKIERRWVPRG